MAFKNTFKIPKVIGCASDGNPPLLLSPNRLAIFPVNDPVIIDGLSFNDFNDRVFPFSDNPDHPFRKEFYDLIRENGKSTASNHHPGLGGKSDSLFDQTKLFIELVLVFPDHPKAIQSRPGPNQRIGRIIKLECTPEGIIPLMRGKNLDISPRKSKKIRLEFGNFPCQLLLDSTFRNLREVQDRNFHFRMMPMKPVDKISNSDGENRADREPDKENSFQNGRGS